MTGNFGRANDGSVMIVAAALALGAAPAPALSPAKLAGFYEIHQMEMAGGLELKRDGHFRYALFYVLCGVCAAAAQIFVDPSSTVPMVGASGAIAGVLAAYGSRYPRSRG